jgi:Fe-S-cluster containining protein
VRLASLIERDFFGEQVLGVNELPVIESCDHCGACCMQVGHPPFTDEERQHVPYELLAEIDEHVAQLEGAEDTRACIWLDLETKRCLHYEQRPHVCRDFERGSTACGLIRWRFGIGRRG